LGSILGRNCPEFGEYGAEVVDYAGESQVALSFNNSAFSLHGAVAIRSLLSSL
jgi:hypothetical protein